MSLEGGFDEVNESFFSRAFSVSSCAIRTSNCTILACSGAIAASINLATSCCVNRLGILL